MFIIFLLTLLNTSQLRFNLVQAPWGMLDTCVVEPCPVWMNHGIAMEGANLDSPLVPNVSFSSVDSQEAKIKS